MQRETQAIAIEDVWKSYDGGVSFAIRHITLKVASREFLALIGTSGSGKTTLLKCINRLIEPTRGTVAVDGAEVRTVDPVQLRRRIGYVFQGVGLFPHLTVAENIGVTLRLLHWSKDAIAARVAELLDLVRLPRELATRFPETLSGGQSQRTGLARALAARPKIMLMDEPFAAVDPITRDALSRDYRAVHDSLGLTTVMVIREPARLARIRTPSIAKKSPIKMFQTLREIMLRRGRRGPYRLGRPSAGSCYADSGCLRYALGHEEAKSSPGCVTRVKQSSVSSSAVGCWTVTRASPVFARAANRLADETDSALFHLPQIKRVSSADATMREHPIRRSPERLAS